MGWDNPDLQYCSSLVKLRTLKFSNVKDDMNVNKVYACEHDENIGINMGSNFVHRRKYVFEQWCKTDFKHVYNKWSRLGICLGLNFEVNICENKML